LDLFFHVGSKYSMINFKEVVRVVKELYESCKHIISPTKKHSHSSNSGFPPLLVEDVAIKYICLWNKIHVSNYALFVSA
jgi:hypothetical protein